MMGCSIASQLMTMVMLRGTVRFDPRPLLLVGGAAGVALAIPGLNWIEPRTSRWLFGAFLAGYAAYLSAAPDRRGSCAGSRTHAASFRRSGRRFGRRIHRHARRDPFDLVRTTRCSKDEQRGQVQPFILGMQLLTLIMLAPAPAGVPRDFWYQLAMALPALLAGSFLGMQAFRRIDGDLMRKAILLNSGRVRNADAAMKWTQLWPVSAGTRRYTAPRSSSAHPSRRESGLEADALRVLQPRDGDPRVLRMRLRRRPARRR